MTSPHAIGLSGSFGGHRIDQLLFSLALPWQENRPGESPLSLASGQTAPPKGEPSRGGGQYSLLLKRAVRLPGKPTCLSLWERWHGGAVTERVSPGTSHVSIEHLVGAAALRSRWRLCRLTDAAYPLRVLGGPFP